MRLRKVVIDTVAGFMPTKKMRRNLREFLMYRSWYCIKRHLVPHDEYDYILNLGDTCFAATALNLARLRKFSGPFDWIGGANLDTRVEMMENKFKDFFNASDFEMCNNLPGRYYNTRTNMLFLHDFSHDGNFESEFPDVRDKYRRRCDRFIKYLSSGRRVLLVCVSSADTTDDAARALQRLRARFGDNLDMLFIHACPGVKHCRIKRHGANLYVGNVVFWNDWGDWERKDATRMFLNALARFKLSNQPD